MLTPDVSPVSLMLPCYLKVVAVNASTFGGESCAHLGEMIGSWGDNPTFVMACESVVQFATGGSAAAACDAAPSPSQRAECLSVVWGLLAGDCPAGDPVEQQVCLYEAAAAVSDEGKCDVLARVGNPEMANDCRAAITKDPSWCAKTEDPELRASCCENFRGTDDYDICFASIGEDATGEDKTAATDEEMNATDVEESTTTEPIEEDPPPAIPAGVYTGTFDARIMADVISQDFGTPEINTMTVGIDAEGLISGDLHVHQEGQFQGCAGALSDWVGTIDHGQIIGPHFPLTVTASVKTVEADPFDAGTWDNSQCIWPPAMHYDEGPLPLEFVVIEDGVLSGLAGDYVPFELELVP